jgi:uncharacterized protein
MAESKSAALPLGYAPKAGVLRGSGGAHHNGCHLTLQPTLAKVDVGDRDGLISRVMGSNMRMTCRGIVGGGLLALIAVTSAGWASAASVNCRARGLTSTEAAVCGDPQLLRTDTQFARRADALARRLNFGQYLGLRHWEAEAAMQRDQCEGDRACIAAHYRAQARVLGRVEQCVETHIARRSCLRNALAGEREAARR